MESNSISITSLWCFSDTDSFQGCLLNLVSCEETALHQPQQDIGCLQRSDHKSLYLLFLFFQEGKQGNDYSPELISGHVSTVLSRGLEKLAKL